MTNNKQQTAVEWLVGQLQQTKDWQRVINEANQSTTAVRDVIREAKEMENHQNLIKLPSDEDISEESMDLYGKLSASITDVLQYKAFKRGAKWMRDKIQGGEQ